MAEQTEELIFVGYTNGYQILYATEDHGGEGMFYATTEHDCYIPLYMLKSHAHRLQTTSNMEVTLDMVKGQAAGTTGERGEG